VLKGKTWKREVAALLLTFLCYTILGGDVEMVKVIVYPFMTFAAVAFGLDWKSKQDKQGGV
jgi:hypothetical protein